MNATSIDRAVGNISIQGLLEDCSTCSGFGDSHTRFSTKGLRISWKLQRKGSLHRSCTVKSSSSHSTSINPIMLSDDNNNDFENISNESSLILIRHGESFWNEMNLFSGCVDVPLTVKGIEEAIEAGRRISSIPIDIIFTSALARAQMTAMLAMTQHRTQKVPVIIHNHNERARLWTKIHSENTKNETIPVVRAWQLNERMYGDLQGFNKKEMAKIYGKEQVHAWRRTYYTRPPNGESLEMTSDRAVVYFKEHIEPQLLLGKHVMVAAHANSLRAIIKYLDKLSAEEVINLELSNGTPMLYIYREGRFIRRGSPLGSGEAGVYAFTRDLASYRQKLDEMSKRDRHT